MQGIVPTNRMRKAAASGAIRHDAWPSLVELVPDGVLETSGGAILRANTLAATLLGAWLFPLT